MNDIIPLNPMDQKILNELTSKPASELFPHELAILKARRSYLTKEQEKAIFGKKKEESKPSTKKNNNKKTEDNKSVDTKKTIKPPTNDKKVEDVDPELDKLMADAKELGIKVDGLNKEQIEKAIDLELAKN